MTNITVLEKIKYHYDNKKYAKFFREVGKKTIVTSAGYIVGYSDDFILLQVAGDFELLGYSVFPVSQLKKIRYNNWDKYLDKIMTAEGEADKVGGKHKIDLSNWQSIFTSISEYNLNVIVECENPDIESFTIGPIVTTTKSFVYISNFNPVGYLDEEPTYIDFENISYVKFDDRYANVFGKYLRTRKIKKNDTV